jgi:hypothetical protein
MLSKAHVTALATGDSWLEQGATILIFGPPSVGKSHLGTGIGHALIDAGYRKSGSRLVLAYVNTRPSWLRPTAVRNAARYFFNLGKQRGHIL